MPGISIHVVDVAHGRVAVGMPVELLRIDASGAVAVCAGVVASNGLLQHTSLEQRFQPGVYEARFGVAAFYRDRGVALPEVPFLDVVCYRFGVADPEQHYHLPFKCTPWGYSCFRGGA